MSTRVWLAGSGMTSFGAHTALSVKNLCAQAFDEATKDAGCRPQDIQAAYFGNSAQGALEGQHSIRGQVALRSLGLGGLPVVNVENACASGSTALHLAVNHIRSGAADIVLAIGVEKMVGGDKAKSLALFDGGWDVHTREANIRTLAGSWFDPAEVLAGNQRRSVFMDLYAMMARHHMEHYGTTQLQLAMVAEKNHFHSTFNPLAQFQRAFSIEEILAAPAISGPLTLPMCAALSDGASAVILASDEGLRRLRGSKPLAVLASVLRSGSDRDPRDFDRHICRLAANSAYEQAGVGPQEMDVAEVHDAASFGEIIQTECLGFCPPGEGGALAQSGQTRLGGRIPVNTSGGLQSKGHPIGATGLGQIHELALQLRGRAQGRQVPEARFAIAENGGGLIGVEEATTVITILGRETP